ncbi:hypothetical protein XENOCAPTIV_023100 [Xenoophorus captivus]|uniref:Filamin C n=1 Tax=Xenoophorus captivus TaxID=1517983 RepID=A0ABV0R4I0_9TELE
MVSWGGVNIPESPFRVSKNTNPEFSLTLFLNHRHFLSLRGCHENRHILKFADGTVVSLLNGDKEEHGPVVEDSVFSVFMFRWTLSQHLTKDTCDISIGIKCAPGVVGPAEADIDFDIIRNDNDTFTVKYTPPGAGSYTIMVLFAEHVRVELNKPTHFTVNTKGAGKANLDCSFSGPTKGEAVKDFEITNNHDNTHTVKYTPVQQGPLGVAVTYGGDHIAKSPFNVAVAPTLDLSKVEPGLSPETSQVKFIPREAGPYQVELTYDGVPIPGSPYTPTAYPSTDPSKVRCSGPGLERAKVGETGEFVVDCTNAGPAELTIEIISDSGTEAEVHIQDNGDGTYTITYIPLYPGSYTLTIRYGGQDVPNFPARLNVEPAVDASGVHVGAGTGGLGLAMEGPSEAKMSCTDNKDGSCRVEYIPYEPGTYNLNITYGGHRNGNDENENHSFVSFFYSPKLLH